MAITAQPGVTTYAWLNAAGQTGLAGTLSFGVVDSDGDYLPGYPATTGIAETDEPGIYRAMFTTPGTVGDYSVVWSDVPGYPAASEQLIVSTTAPGPVVGGGRPGMAALIARVRRLIGDVDTPVWTDAEIQDALDQHADHSLQVPLVPIPVADPQAGYTVWISELDAWDADAALLDANYAPLAASQADPLAGRWTFAAPQTTVYLTGTTYDVHLAAASLLDAWAARLSREFDVSVDGNTYNRRQQAVELAARADRERQNARPSILSFGAGAW